MATEIETPDIILPKQIINNGEDINDPSAETIYEAFEKTKINFDTIWKLLEQRGYKQEFLSLTGIDTTKGEMEYIAEAIQRGKSVGGAYNGEHWSSEIGQEIIFLTITSNDAVSHAESTSFTPTWEYRFYRVHVKGQKIGGTAGAKVTSSSVSPAGSFSIRPSQKEFFIDLGNIGSSNVWTEFNRGQPEPNLGMPWVISGLSMVRATQNGSQKTWRFSGNVRLGIDTGHWGGSNVTDPDYLLAESEDFELLSNQPAVYSNQFITKSSKAELSIELSSSVAEALTLTPERTSFGVRAGMEGGQINGFIVAANLYDGMDIYISNRDVNDVVLLRVDDFDGVPFFFQDSKERIVLTKNATAHFRYNEKLGRAEHIPTAQATGGQIVVTDDISPMILDDSHHGMTIFVDGVVSIRVPVGLRKGFWCDFVVLGEGTLVMDHAVGITLNSRNGLRLSNLGRGRIERLMATDKYYLNGDWENS